MGGKRHKTGPCTSGEPFMPDSTQARGKTPIGGGAVGCAEHPSDEGAKVEPQGLQLGAGGRAAVFYTVGHTCPRCWDKRL
eukprot:CAMPEP_0170418768 /NCGR_PEP_ID=MMETSP0117_2-20130122/34441_1 /TAXON_ID=400756 /ORGANISM="Durinskia baltica, Strain CSIRO CS-38" /LENGTH=79 /DNA_ID=CAMNT_0010677073 /DNA_START=173 /DNA_END=410 /DNA_ORIENTATION=-